MTHDETSSAEYFFSDHASDAELARLKLIEQFNDPSTTRHLEAIGVTEGWRCLEVGAGAGSVARWLSGRVGASGKVIAADIDTRFLGGISAHNIEVRQFDITEDPLEPSSYDLIHARNVLTHLSDPLAVLRRITPALKPGGWLLVEDVDNGPVEAADPNHPCADAFDRCTQARITFIKASGIMDLRYGRTLPGHVEQLGLVELGNEAVSQVGAGQSPMSQLMLQSFKPMDDVMVANGVIGQSEVSDAQSAMEDPSFRYRSGLLVAAWGRTPSS